MMTPLLVWTGWAPPAVAVGTDLVWNALTKVVGATVHYRKGNVDTKLVQRLALGSIPGALLGTYLLSLLKTSSSVASVDRLIVHLLGGTLITVAVSIMVRGFIQRHGIFANNRLETIPKITRWAVPSIGFVVGLMVAFTSVGSGSLIMTSLLLLCPRERLNLLVGSDVFHGLLLVGVAAVGHWRLGDVNMPLMLSLLIGSVPGVWLGSSMTTRISERALRPVVATLLFVTGVKLI